MNFVSAESMDEALEMLDSFGSEAAILAGGSDLMMQLDRGQIDASMLLHIERLRDLAFVRHNGAVSIGALATHRRLTTSSELAPAYGAIRTAAASVGGWQTQAVGTIAGNICNASPAADLAPPLLVHGAQISLVSRRRGHRTLALQDFLVGRRRTRREPDELLTELTLDPVPPRSADIYIKVGRRAAMEVAIAGLALRLTLSDDGEVIEQARVATCALGPVPCRAHETEALLNGARLTATLKKEAGAVLTASVDPIDDARGSAAYRRAVTGRVLAHALSECAARIRTTLGQAHRSGNDD